LPWSEKQQDLALSHSRLHSIENQSVNHDLAILFCKIKEKFRIQTEKFGLFLRVNSPNSAFFFGLEISDSKLVLSKTEKFGLFLLVNSLSSALFFGLEISDSNLALNKTEKFGLFLRVNSPNSALFFGLEFFRISGKKKKAIPVFGNGFI
jgi:hypothetical protein